MGRLCLPVGSVLLKRALEDSLQLREPLLVKKFWKGLVESWDDSWKGDMPYSQRLQDFNFE